jgi:catechol 2,3-dioxygenase-like lactoylglutathione lyase family enzyme
MSVPIGLDYVDHVSLAVADLERSLRFYVALTGVEPDLCDERIDGEGLQRVSAAPGLRMRYATLPLRNVEINLIEFSGPGDVPAPRPRQSPGTIHLCFRAGDLDGTVARMRAAGFEFVADPYTVPSFEATPGSVGLRFAYFDDPDGNHLEVISDGDQVPRTR